MIRIGTTSFIKPADRLTNALFLKDTVDEIELLYTDSRHEYDIPDEKEVDALSELDVRYNIHMPYDRDLSIMDEWKFMVDFTEKLKKLKAVTHTFHIQPEPDFFKGLEWFIGETDLPVTLENGGNDFQLLIDMPETGAGVCLDVGHMVMYRQDVIGTLAKLDKKIEMFHLHGVQNSKDHKSIRHLDTKTAEAVLNFAKEKSLTVSLEVFNEQDLRDSLLCIDQLTF